MNSIKLTLVFAFVIHLNCFCYCFVELIAAASAVALFSLGVMIFKHSTNCCTKSEIPANFDFLETSLRRNVYGQPFVIDTVVDALRSHWNENSKPNKALTMSFHGGPGIGKNYVAKFIQEALYAKGPRSQQHVHNFIAGIHFPEKSLSSSYKDNLRQWIKGNITKCPKQLFVFDEVHHMPSGVLDAIIPFIDYHKDIDGVSSSEAIFIFLSNIGTQVLNQYVYELWKIGKDRETLKLQDFEVLVSEGAFNEEGGFIRISRNFIDHYIPFLPLMEPHVRLCIQDEFEKRGHSPSEKEIREILEFIDFGPESVEIFAKTGCKRISQKVALLMN